MRNTRPSDYDKERPDSQLVKNGQASDLESTWRRIRQCVKQFGPIVPCIYKERDSLWRNEQVSLIWINYLTMLVYVDEASNTFLYNHRVPHVANILSHWYKCKWRTTSWPIVIPCNNFVIPHANNIDIFSKILKTSSEQNTKCKSRNLTIYNVKLV